MKSKNQYLCVILMIVIAGIQALFEDQVGKFDWTHRYVGKPKFVISDMSGEKNLLVGTKQNVIASLSANNGDIAWRQVLERGDGGRLDGLHHYGTVYLSYSGGRTVRAWAVGTGHLTWEVVLQQQPAAKRGVSVLVTKDSGNEYLVALHDGKLSGIEVGTGTVIWTTDLPHSASHEYQYVTASGTAIRVAGRSASTVVMATVSFDGKATSGTLVAGLAGADDVCSFVGTDHLACAGNLGVLRYVKTDSTQVQTVSLGTQGRVRSITASSGQEAILLSVAMDTGHVIVEFRAGKAKVLKVLERVSTVEFLHEESGDHVVALSRRSSEDVLLEKYLVDGKMNKPAEELKMHVPEHHGQPSQMYSLGYKKRDANIGYRYLVLCDDHSILMITQLGKVSWLREEALASVLSVEMVDLPVSETEQKIEDEFGAPDDDIVSMFKKRIMTQLSQLHLVVEELKEHLKGSVPHDQAEHDAEDEVDENVDLTRDRFNLHKMVVVATEAGKIFGLYSQTGSVVWKLYVKDLAPFSKHGRAMPIILLRSTVHYPHPAQCMVVGRQESTGRSLVVSFEPITGELVERADLKYTVKQIVAMQHVDEHFLKGVLLMDTDRKIHVYPSKLESLARRHADEYFLFTADPAEGMMRGFALRSGKEGLSGNELWTVNLMKEGQTITNVVTKRPNEHVHSQGRVLADRNVLYKYLNPNLVVVTTQGSDPVQKGHNFLTIYLVDAVSGSIIFHTSHKRASGEVHVVHSENWVVYSYWNQKARRHEMSVLELFEGHRQSNSTVFSSLEPPPLPWVEKQAYIFPTRLSAMGVTLTEKGVTNKHLLVALEVGGVFELPMAFLDPRRPVEPTPEHREEGILPYIPELAIQTDAVINYNQSLVSVRGIYTAPAGLESTSLVFVYGLDLFATRVFPSKMFDVLKEDFDYWFISAVVIGMILVSMVSQKLASRKALRRNWK